MWFSLPPPFFFLFTTSPFEFNFFVGFNNTGKLSSLQRRYTISSQRLFAGILVYNKEFSFFFLSPFQMHFHYWLMPSILHVQVPFKLSSRYKVAGTIRMWEKTNHLIWCRLPICNNLVTDPYVKLLNCHSIL